MPETSKLGEAMEKVGQDATESFDKGSKGIGDKLHDTLTKSTDKIKDVFSKIGSDGGKAATDSFQKESKGIEDAADDTGKKAGGRLRDSIGSKFDGLGEQLGTALGAKLGEKLGDGLKQVDKYAKDVGIDLGEWTGPLQDSLGKATDTKNQIGELAGTISGLPGPIGKVAEALGKWALPIGLAVEAADKLRGFVENMFPGEHDREYDADGVPKSAFERWADRNIPGVMALTGDKPESVHNDPNSRMRPPVGSDFDPGSLGNVGGSPDSLISGGAGLGGAGGTNDTDWSAVGSGNSVPLIQKPDGTWTSSNPSWAHLIQRESGGNPSVFNNYDSNAQAGDPSQGLFQFTRATWAAHGGLKYGRDPSKATPQQQAEIAANLIRANPSGSDWGAGMSGRENAGGLLGGLGAGGATSSGGDDFYPSGGSSGGRSASFGGGGAKVPIGTDSDPIYTATSKSVGGSAGGSDTESQGQQLGSGLLGGLMQSVGLDGSVFKTFGGSSNPMGFGATKLATGLLNWGMGQMQHGPAVSANGMPVAPGSAHSSAGGAPTTNNYYGDVHPFNVSQTGVSGNGTSDLKEMANATASRGESLSANLPG
jgi:hypothetical protein